MEQRGFHTVAEILPIMLRFAPLLLSYALSNHSLLDLPPRQVNYL